jgi:O-antigen/teichoic acid export membrane protein
VARFLHLLSAQAMEAALSALFFLYLAWKDPALYGAVMYALAAGSIAMKAVQFGLYYPQVTSTARAGPGRAPCIAGQVNLIKLFLLGPVIALVGGLVVFGDFSGDTAAVLVLLVLGFTGEAFAETFFADLRIRGRQDAEGRIRMAGSVLGYGLGFAAATLGGPASVVAWFKPLSAAVQLAMGLRAHREAYGALPPLFADGREAVGLFRSAAVFAAIEILGIVYNKTNIFFLERETGMLGVGVYSATWNLVDPLSTLGSEQFLGRVIFPLLAPLWGAQRKRALRLIRATSLWLLVAALPLVLVLHVESERLIGLIYPDAFRDAAWMQRHLAWTVLLSFENNLFAYAMMVAERSRMLLLFAVITTLLNLLLNGLLIPALGLLGGCLVILATKAAMTALTLAYCQGRWGLFRLSDLLFPGGLWATAGLLYLLLSPVLGREPALIMALGACGAAARRWGRRFLGEFSGRGDPPTPPGGPGR